MKAVTMAIIFQAFTIAVSSNNLAANNPALKVALASSLTLTILFLIFGI